MRFFSYCDGQNGLHNPSFLKTKDIFYWSKYTYVASECSCKARSIKKNDTRSVQLPFWNRLHQAFGNWCKNRSLLIFTYSVILVNLGGFDLTVSDRSKPYSYWSLKWLLVWSTKYCPPSFGLLTWDLEILRCGFMIVNLSTDPLKPAWNLLMWQFG